MPEDKYLLTLTPEDDKAVKWGSWWLHEYIYQYAKNSDVKALDLNNESDTKENIIDYFTRYKIALLEGLGHGNTHLFSGYGKKIIFTKGSNEDAELLKGTVGSFLSCSFGDSMNWWLKNGMKAFYGYNRTFYIPIATFPNSRSTYVFHPHCTFSRSLIEGKTVKEAYDATIQEWKNSVEKAPRSIQRTVIWNYESAVYDSSDPDYNPFKDDGIEPEPDSWICKYLGWLLKYIGWCKAS